MALAAISDGELMSMMRSAALLSPIVYLGQVTSPLARIGAETLLAETLHWLHINEFNPRGKVVIELPLHMCKDEGTDCTNMLTSFAGENCCLNSSIVNVFLQHEPQPTSTKNMIHLSQSKKFGQKERLHIFLVLNQTRIGLKVQESSFRCCCSSSST